MILCVELAGTELKLLLTQANHVFLATYISLQKLPAITGTGLMFLLTQRWEQISTNEFICT